MTPLTVSTTLLPDGSVTVIDGGTTFPPLSPEAVQAVAALADASTQASQTRDLTEALMGLAQLITTAGPAAGGDAYAQVTVTPTDATAVLDPSSFATVQGQMPGKSDGAGGWQVGRLKVKPKPPPDPTPTPTPGGAA